MAQVFGSGVALAGYPAPLPRPERLDAFAAPSVVKGGGATAVIGIAIAASWAAQGRDAAPIEVAAADAPVSTAPFAHVPTGAAAFGRTAPIPLTLLPVGARDRMPGTETVTERPDSRLSLKPARPRKDVRTRASVRRHLETSGTAPGTWAGAPVDGAVMIEDAAPPTPSDQPDPVGSAAPVLAAASPLRPADRAVTASDPAPASPVAGAPRQTSDGVEFTVATRFDGVTAGRLPLLLEGGTAGDTSRVSDNISVRLDDLVDLLSARMSPELLGWLKSSRQIESYVTLNDLRAHGIAVAFDDHDRLILKSM